MRKRWKLRPTDDATVQDLQEKLKIHPVFCQLLVQRNITTYDAAKTFFRPVLSNLHDPFLMRDMEAAVDRLETAIRNKERILLYGDYDVDGTTSVAMMYDFLSQIHERLDYYIPDRYKEGYGVSMEGVDYAKQNGISLIIAMDCGIKANAKVAKAKKIGIDFIICDHHLPEGKLPDAVAVLDPKRPDCNYPYKELSGAGVTFKLVQAFCQKHELDSAYWQRLLEFLVISIAADIVPITGENRILAYYGLKKLNCTERPGMKALIHESRRNHSLVISDIVFGLAPMINAAGRLGDAKQAVRLMLSDNKFSAYENAHFLNQKNKLRKEYDQLIAEEAKKMFRDFPDWEKRKSIVLYQPHWHKGIVGIAASRLVEKYHRPTIILTESNGKIVGSARSVKGFNIYKAVKSCEDLLLNFGGHNFAAGLTLEEDNLENFRERFEEYVSENLEKDLLIPEIPISSELDFDSINDKFMKILKQFAPFGPGNRNPIFATKYVNDTGYSRLLKGNHLKLSLKQGESETMSGIAFSRGDDLDRVQDHKPFHICYRVEENNWKDKRYLQLNVNDIWF
ncbi:MAG: single-stranded-DNA-specific exonuclease [Paraglaciecola sp.]|jgi:single-stranded-DNA-specific exonuclease